MLHLDIALLSLNSNMTDIRCCLGQQCTCKMACSDDEQGEETRESDRDGKN